MRSIKKIVTLLITCCLGFNSFGQIEKRIDSLLAIVNSPKSSDSLKTELYIEISSLYAGTNRPKTLSYIQKALQIYPKKYPAFKANLLVNKAGAFRMMGRIDSALVNINEALHIAMSNNYERTVADAYQELGDISQAQGNSDDALEFFGKCLALRLMTKQERALSMTYTNIGIIYGTKAQWNKAIEYFKKALELDKKFNRSVSLGHDYNNLGIVYITRKLYDSATIYLMEGMRYRRANKDYIGIGGSFNNLALMEYDRKNMKPALTLADSAFFYAQKVNSKHLLAEVYSTYYDVYRATKQYEKALDFYIKQNDIKNELGNTVNKQRLGELEKGIELELKEKELLEKDVELMKSEKDKEKKNNLILVFLVGSMALLGFVIYIFKINNKLKDVNKVITEQKSIIQEKHKDITDSIQYAQKIQNSIILSDKALEAKVKDSFVLFKPRDIVSGDFYWYSEKNNLKLLAVADCTGHGVPGAFMSMIGITMLNQIVNEKGITSPAEILNRLRDGVINSLNLTKEEAGKRDGMDVALIAWTDYSLVYAGANNPCLILRDNEFIELKANKQPVGLYEKQEPFTEQKMFLQKNDQVFLFTDGVTDQFGGEKVPPDDTRIGRGKKVKLKGLKDWLVSLSDKEAQVKKATLEKYLNDWKGELSQTDDILIIGLKC